MIMDKNAVIGEIKLTHCEIISPNSVELG